MNSNEIVLSYGESLLRENDVNLLTGPYWLNDTIISFYFEFLEKVVFCNNHSFLFVSPEVTQCIKVSSQSQLAIFLDPLVQNQNREFIFFAVNDHDVLESSGGTHWSLLVVSIPEMMLFHFDSNQSNFDNARVLGYKVATYFSFPLTGSVENALCLQQSNGYDCGIHVICNTEHLAHHASFYQQIKNYPQLKPESINTKRSEILRIIDQLKKKASDGWFT